MALKDPFVTLGLVRKDIEKLSIDEAKEAIRKVYRGLAAKYHPDRNPGDLTAIDTFKECTAAYDALIEPDKLIGHERAKWDTAWQHRKNSEPAQAGGEQGGFDWDSFFGGGFGGFSGRRTKRQHRPGPSQEEDEQPWRKTQGGFSRRPPGPFDEPKDPRFNEIDPTFEHARAYNPNIKDPEYIWTNNFRHIYDLSPEEQQTVQNASASPLLQRNAALIYNHPVLRFRFNGGDEYVYNSSVMRVLERVAWGVVPRSLGQQSYPPETFTQTALWANEDFRSGIFVQRLYEASFVWEEDAQQQKLAEKALRQLTEFMWSSGHLPPGTNSRAVAMEVLAHFAKAHQSSLREAMDVLKPEILHPGATKDEAIVWAQMADDPHKFSVFAFNRAHRHAETTLQQLKFFQWEQPKQDYRDRDLLWALKRAQEILGEELEQNPEGEKALSNIMRPTALFQFHRTKDRESNNMGFNDIFWDNEKHMERPNVRSDGFWCDSFFVSDFLAQIAPEHRAWVDPSQNTSGKQPDWITGRFKEDEQIGFVITACTGSQEIWIQKFNLVLVTPDIPHTQKAFEMMVSQGLLKRQHLQDMLEYGYVFRGLPHLTDEVKIDEPFLKMLETILGVARPKAVLASLTTCIKYGKWASLHPYSCKLGV